MLILFEYKQIQEKDKQRGLHRNSWGRSLFLCGVAKDMREEILKLTKEMVLIPSVNGTEGEYYIGQFIENYMRALPYFKEHPDQVIVQKLENDPLNRRNVFALLKGEKDNNPRTIIFHGHTDTVGVEDFGELKEWAFNPDELMKRLSQVELPEDVRKDLESGDYLFGRGACDMKSGDAVFMVMMKHIAQHIQDFSGNILLSCNPVEENLHTGVIQGIDTLISLKEQHQLDYVLAINNDYTCPMYPEDSHHYIYTGVGGKLLPCFYIQGKETHVGQCFEGFDPTTVAGNLVTEVNLNPAFSDGYEGEYSLPPVALKLKDLKSWYNVQTAKEALVYFNYFVHNAEMDEILDKLRGAANKAVAATNQDRNRKYQDFCQISGKEYRPIDIDCSVLTFGELMELAVKKQAVENKEIDISKTLSDMTAKAIEDKIDAREIPIELIRWLLPKAGIYHPVVVLYFAAPYCPHNTLKDVDTNQKLKKVVEKIAASENLEFEICKFFPSLSDSSYLTIDDSLESIQLLRANFPQMNQLYPVPLEKIRNLGIKAVDFGVYGKDAHKWTERLYIPYSFEVLPKLIEETLKEFL